MFISLRFYLYISIYLYILISKSFYIFNSIYKQICIYLYEYRNDYIFIYIPYSTLFFSLWIPFMAYTHIQFLFIYFFILIYKQIPKPIYKCTSILILLCLYIYMYQ